MTKLKTRLLKDLPIKTTPITDDDYVINTNSGTTKLKVKDITKNIENKVEILEDNLSEFSEQLDNKASKNEVFSMANMGQDIKEAMTGGSVAVVGKDAVLTENIVDKQVTINKLSENLRTKIYDLTDLANGYCMKIGCNLNSSIDKNTIEITTTTTYGHAGLVVQNKIGDKYVLVTEVTNIGEVSVSTLNLMVGYGNNSNANTSIQVNGKGVGSIGKINVGETVKKMCAFISENSTYNAVICGVFTNTNGAILRIKQRIYNITEIPKNEIDKLDFLNLNTNCIINSDYAIESDHSKLSDSTLSVEDNSITINKLERELQEKFTTNRDIATGYNMRNGITSITQIDKNTVSGTTNTTYGHLGIVFKNINGNKYVVVSEITNIGTLDFNAKLIIGYNNSYTSSGNVMINGTNYGGIGTIKVGETLVNTKTITSKNNASGITLGVMTTTDGASFKIKQKIYDVTSLNDSDINSIDWVNVKPVVLTSDYANYAHALSPNAEIKGISTFWKGKTWISLGDSITAPGTYQTFVKNELGFANVINKGIAGQSIKTFTDNLSQEEINSADLITIYGALNDMYPNAPALGRVTDIPAKEGSTFIAHLKYQIEKILTMKPSITLVIIGTHNAWDKYRPQIYQPIRDGKNIGDYVNGMGEVARMYGLHFIDMYAESGLNALTMSNYSGDNCHLNAIGYEKRIAPVIINHLKSIQIY